MTNKIPWNKPWGFKPNYKKEEKIMSDQNNRNELFTALAKAQAEMTGALTDSKNPFFKSKYADLASVWNAIRIPFTKQGLCVIQTMHLNADKELVLVTTLGHSSGQAISSESPIRPVKNDPQGLGSAITYMRRYALAAIAGVYQIDDDGEHAMARPDHNDSLISKIKEIVVPHEVPPIQERGELLRLQAELKGIISSQKLDMKNIYAKNRELHGLNLPSDCNLEQLKALIEVFRPAQGMLS